MGFKDNHLLKTRAFLGGIIAKLTGDKGHLLFLWQINEYDESR